MPANLEALAAHVVTALGATLEGRTLEHIGAWLGRIEEWNARIDLTAARSREELVDLMLADALILAPKMPQGARTVDIGSGAGAPGMALALVREDLRVTLVEPLAKRASFLRTVLGVVGRTDVVIDRTRGETLAGRRAWDVAVSRATLPPPVWLALGTTLAAPGGVVWVLLAKGDAPTHSRAAIEVDFAYRWPLTSAERRAIAYRVLS